MRVFCCVCGKEKIDGIWRKVPSLPVEALSSHGYCPDCASDSLRQDWWLQKLRKATNAKPQA